MAGPSAEGVTRFRVDHETRMLEERVYGETAVVLAAWREVLARLGLIGRDPSRYQGAGYGNVSARVSPFGDVGRGQRRFLVTGTGTGGRPRVTLEDFSLVERYDLVRNHVRSRGAIAPSSESLTHGAIYDIAPAARVVLHAHAPEIWRHARALGLPITRVEALNGTPEMALEVQRLYRESTLSATGILAMGGHEDGVIAFAATAAGAGETLVRHLARALSAAS
jgi:class II aldolase/adducin N-terminal domain-containing protein